MNMPKISAMQTQATSEAVKIIPYKDFKGLEGNSLATYNLMLLKADAGYTFKFSKATPNEAENQKVRKAVQDSLLVGPVNGDKEFAYLQTVAKESSNAKIIKAFLTEGDNASAPLTGEDVVVLLTCLRALDAKARGRRFFFADGSRPKPVLPNTVLPPTKKPVLPPRKFPNKKPVAPPKTTVPPPKKPVPPDRTEKRKIWEETHEVSVILAKNKKNKKEKKSSVGPKVSSSDSSVASKKERVRSVPKTKDVVTKKRGDPNTIIRDGARFRILEDGTEKRLFPNQ